MKYQYSHICCMCGCAPILTSMHVLGSSLQNSKGLILIDYKYENSDKSLNRQSGRYETEDSNDQNFVKQLR